jgi:hypothetical protein
MVILDGSDLISIPYKERTNTCIVMYIASSYKQEQKRAKINGTGGMLE